jgi:hypothetical protein
MRKRLGPIQSERALSKVEGKKPTIHSEQTALILLYKPRANSCPLTLGDLSRLIQQRAEELEDR